MRSKWMTRLGIGALTGLAMLGCAQERDPINRVQANALAKSFFVGEDLKDTSDDPEFYKRGTVIDVGYGANTMGLFTSTYAQPVSRIRWEITETHINARLAYERIKDSDGKGKQYDGERLKKTNDGQIVASYRIQSHFDIRRDYNPQTGEELNIIVENASDRPWYEREYFRVDWSKNLVTSAYDFDTLAMMGIYGSVQYEPLSYTVLDPNAEDAPHFDVDEGYFDVTNKAFATPQMVDLSYLGWGIDKFPACWLPDIFAGGQEPAGNCNPMELTIRDSYRRVVDNDYEPMNVDGWRFQSYGIFTTDYRGYERNYGMLDDHWFRFASRYNMWERSHYYDDPVTMTGAVACATKDTTKDPGNDPNRDLDGNGTADECEAVGPGSRCDVFSQKCTLPYSERKTVTIPWYVAGDTGENLFEPVNWATLEWDLAMRTAAQTARLVECRRTGGGDECDAKFPMWKGQQDDNDEAAEIVREMDYCFRSEGWGAESCKAEGRAKAAKLAEDRGIPGDASTLAIGEVAAMEPVIVLCHNPVIGTDHPACGPEGLAPRLGDLRYNTVLMIEKPQSISPWGIMVDADDPLTGEKISASINVWTHVTDLAVQGLVDLVRYTNGELSTADITNATNVREWVSATKLGAASTGPTLSEEEVHQRLAASTTLDAKTFAEIAKNPTPAQIAPYVAAVRDKARDVAVRADIASPAQNKVNTLMRAARGTNIEAELMNPAMLQRAGISGTVPLDGTVAVAASPLALNNPKVRSELLRMRENALAARGACILHEAPEATAMTGMSDILRKKFPPSENESPAARTERVTQMHRYLQRRFTYAVIAHEMGHSIGLRHNFVSNTAALHFRPQYWQLRTKNGTVTKACNTAVDDGSECVGPRYYDPITDEEQSQLLHMFTHSTVMDYPGDVSQDLIGLGAYDYAATRMFYGDSVSVYTNPDYAPSTKIGVGLTIATDNFGGMLGIKYGLKGSQSGSDDFHYSQLQKNYTVIKDCRPVQPEKPASWNEAVDGIWDPVMDGKIVSVDGQPTKCRQQPVDYVGWEQLRMPTAKELNRGYYRGGPSIDAENNRLRVPYGFATDNWADLGNVSVFRHDNGADPYEQAMFLITTQENRHIIDNYRRGRSTFSVRAAADRSYSRYNEKLLNLASGLGFFASIYNDIGIGQGLAFETLWPFIVNEVAPDNVITASVVFDHFTRQLSRPDAGEHYKRATAFGDPVLRSVQDTDDYGPGSMFNSQALVTIPNGATGYLRDVGIGGRPLNNNYSDDKGEFYSEYIANAGSYYDKINVAILLSESEDRFVSQSRRDFYDARFRATGLADVMPEGFRRVMANVLTGDRSLFAPRVVSNASGKPLLDTEANDPNDPLAKKYPAQPLGWTSWWGNDGPEVCFPTQGRFACTNYTGGNGFNPLTPANTVPVDPQIGWEVQKFMIAWSLAHIPANQKTNWVDMMRIYRLGQNSAPEIANRMEWEDPISGELYYAPTYGTECLFGDASNGCAGGKIVQRGISARVLEYANGLTAKGYKLDVVNYPATALYPAGFNEFGRAMIVRQPDGTPVVAFDSAVSDINSAGGLQPTVECDQNIDPSCKPLTINQNHYAYELKNYKSIPSFLWETGLRYGLFGKQTPLGQL